MFKSSPGISTQAAERNRAGPCWLSSLSPARFVNEFLQPGLHLVIGEECHIARVSHCQAVPVPQQRWPGLGKHQRNKLATHFCEGSIFLNQRAPHLLLFHQESSRGTKTFIPIQRLALQFLGCWKIKSSPKIDLNQNSFNKYKRRSHWGHSLRIAINCAASAEKMTHSPARDKGRSLMRLYTGPGTMTGLLSNTDFLHGLGTVTSPLWLSFTVCNLWLFLTNPTSPGCGKDCGWAHIWMKKPAHTSQILLKMMPQKSQQAFEIPQPLGGLGCANLTSFFQVFKLFYKKVSALPKKSASPGMCSSSWLVLYVQHLGKVLNEISYIATPNMRIFHLDIS